VEHELAAALEPVLHDLAGPDGVLPEVRDESWPAGARTASAFLYAADGSGMGIRIDLGEPRFRQVVALADQVQEWAVEALWMLGRPATWPSCPAHAASHPLAPVERAGRAVWECPIAQTVMGEIGTL
jgi:hypothetical protein